MHPLYRQTVETLRDLVAFDTTSRNSNLNIIEYIEGKLACHGAVSERVYSADGTKANLIARLGPEAPGGILLSGHTDVVPVDGQKWDQENPFAMEERDGRLYGRGTTDMKGFLACILAQLPEWNKAPLEKPIYMVFSYDEEIGCLGVGSALKVLREKNISPELCVVGEPTNLNVAYAHKLRANVNVAFSATGGHASKIGNPEITCANVLAARLVVALDDGSDVLGALLGNTQLGGATFAVTALDTPHTHNVVAAESKIHFDFRGRPGLSPRQIEDAMQPYTDQVLRTFMAKKSGKAEIAVAIDIGNNGFQCDNQDTINLAMHLAGTNSSGVVAYVCEAARLMEAGFGPATIICGPGNISEAHQPNEYLDASELNRCLGFMDRIGRRVKAPMLMAG